MRYPAHTMAGSDFPRPFIAGFGSSPSRHGPWRLSAPRSDMGSPGSRTESVCTCQGLRPRRTCGVLALTPPAVLPSVFAKTSASGIKSSRGSMAGLCTPLPTLRPRPYERRRTAWGRCGLLLLHRIGLAPTTPRRSPGALRKTLDTSISDGLRRV